MAYSQENQREFDFRWSVLTEKERRKKGAEKKKYEREARENSRGCVLRGHLRGRTMFHRHANRGPSSPSKEKEREKEQEKMRVQPRESHYRARRLNRSPLVVHRDRQRAGHARRRWKRVFHGPVDGSRGTRGSYIAHVDHVRRGHYH